jgi:ferrochelatase
VSRLAVVLFNLGGPDSLAAVRPFLFNLFVDPAIIGLPAPLRQMAAWLLSRRRTPAARVIYGHLGGRSPLLELTGRQAQALERELGEACRVFIAMRYWHPLTDAALKEVADWRPDNVVLLPLYPQFSTTTTASSLRAWKEAATRMGLRVPTVAICCYPTEEGMIEAQTELLKECLDRAGGGARVLFSAHGLPEKIVERGDPYPLQIKMTAQAIVERLGRSDLDWRVCYQSKVGPLAWIGPATVDEIRRAGAESRALVVQPIAFVSEHSETLVELDQEYAHVASEAGVPSYVRVPAVGTHPSFIAGLARLVRNSLTSRHNPCSERGGRLCPGNMYGCEQSRR